MLYSETKERENRFIISLKIGFPFFLLTFLLLYLFKVSNNTLETLVLTICLIPIYIYYIFYLIYNGFKSTLIDSVTRTFNRKEILEKITKTKRNKTVVLIKIDNLADIDKRYGLQITDKILKIFCQKIDEFFKNYNFKDVIIGRYGGGNFLLLLKGRQKELRHLLTIFSKELKNNGIENIEVKIDFSLLDIAYDKNTLNIVKKLFFDIEEEKEREDIFLHVKPDEYENIVLEAIKSEKFIFKYQPAKDKSKKIKILEVLVKIYSKTHGMLSFNEIERVINQIGFESIFYKKLFEVLLKEIENFNTENISFSIKISPTMLRNNEFIIYLNQLFYTKKIDPKMFILEFSEESSYKDIKRFQEILYQYKKSGFKISIDNFGGNNSSLEYLKHLPIDIVKLDIEFTKNIDNKKYRKILNSYINLLKELEIKIMIKFVDKNETLEMLKDLNLDFIQGFIISKPKNLKQIKEII
jgi:diguanylate cyclase (GGDEF)-like protein